MKRRATFEGCGRPSLRMAATETQGAVYVEFLLSFIPLFTFFLGMIQVAMLYSAQLVVQQAAITATRAAAVVLDDNPERYDDQTRLSVEDRGGSGGEESGLPSLFPGGGGGGSMPSLGSDTAGRRYSSIRYAAMIPLITITPAPGAVFGGERLSTAIGSDPEARAVMALVYTRAMTSITFPSEPHGDSLRTSWNSPDENGQAGSVTARVTYVYMCPVPIANRLLCEDGVSLFAGNSSLALVDSFTRMMNDGTLTMAEVDSLSREQDIHDRHFSEWQPMMDEMEAGDGPGFSAAAAVTAATLATNGSPARFRPLQAEATLPVHAANYCYRGHNGNPSGCWRQN